MKERCYSCFRPLALCLCDRIPRVQNEIPVLILQHKCERAHPFNTARLVGLGLANVEVQIVWPNAERRFAASDKTLAGAGLLYPGPNSIDLASLEPGAGPRQLVVLDGTWDDAKGLYDDNPFLAALPCYSLTPASPSTYRIRREPSDTAISTLEAIVLALSLLEPHTAGLAELLGAFNSMIDAQLRACEGLVGRPSTKRFKKSRQREQRAIPAELTSGFDNLVIGYGESVPWIGKRRALVSVTCLRPSDGATFEAFLAPPPDATMTDDHIELMGLSRDTWRDAVDIDELRQRFQAFLRPNDVFVTWNPSTLGLLREALPLLSRALFLKAPYCNFTGDKCGHLQDVALRHSFELRPLPLRGRAATRVAQALAVAELLRRSAQTSTPDTSRCV